MFTLFPHFQLISTEGDLSKNFVFFQSNKQQTDQQNTDNSKKIFKRGLGFGGLTSDHCRIWLDEDLKKQSYVGQSQSHETYDKKQIIHSVEEEPEEKTYLNIKNIEIWGSCSKNTYDAYEERQQNYRSLKNIEECLYDQKGQINDVDGFHYMRYSQTVPIGGRNSTIKSIIPKQDYQW